MGQGLPWQSRECIPLHKNLHSNAGGVSSIPVQGNRIPHAVWCGKIIVIKKMGLRWEQSKVTAPPKLSEVRAVQVGTLGGQ